MVAITLAVFVLVMLVVVIVGSLSVDPVCQYGLLYWGVRGVDGVVFKWCFMVTVDGVIATWPLVVIKF